VIVWDHIRRATATSVWPAASSSYSVHSTHTLRSPAVGATVTRTDGGFRLRLDRPAHGVAPGQAAVLYDRDAVVGAGTIEPAETLTAARAFRSGGE
jgi:tRNA U34 2-thiouridine synthase MnmA/TrmU